MRAFVTTPFPRPLRERIFRVSQADATELCDLDVLLGEAFADAARAVAAAAGVAMADVDLIGSHGQTAVHHPRSAGRLGATLQIGEAAVIAERTGCPVVSDFRVRDVAAGGEGAPLVPLVDHLLFRAPGRRRALQNIGGIANVTLVGDRLADLVAFDNGARQHAARRRRARGLRRRRGLRPRRRARRARRDRRRAAGRAAPPPLPGAAAAQVDRARDFGKDFVYPLLARFERPHGRSAGDADPLLGRGDRAQLPRDAARACPTRSTSRAAARSTRR